MTPMKWAMLAGLAGALVAAGTGCHRAQPEVAPLQGPVALLVRNNAFFDVVVYALPSTDVDSRVRVATVTGNSESQVSVPLTYLRPGGAMVLYLHAIGSRYSWTSPAVMVNPESVMRLDVYANPDGSLSRSTLYSAPRPVAVR
jgi:hypothetical protein